MPTRSRAHPLRPSEPLFHLSYLVTGAAGFIGFHIASALLADGESVLGVDSLNDYYPVALKRARLEQLSSRSGFRFVEADIADDGALATAARGTRVRRIIHLAAQTGVRYSLIDPAAYIRSNLAGHANLLEFARRCDSLEHLCYASSSSVYGLRHDMPLRETDRVDEPVSLYAATKLADELMSKSYAHLYKLPQTGLRFFTVYGPWGRPDMAYWMFTDKILRGEPIDVFNHGNLQRDFTYVDDIVDGVLRVARRGHVRELAVPHALYNIGHNRPEQISHFIALLERLTGRRALRRDLPMQPGDVLTTCADIDAIRTDYGFQPATALDTGMERFVAWFRQYHDL